MVQAVVLKSSWPLSESAWAFVQQLKDQEKNELKVAYKERPPSPVKNEKAQPTSQKGKPKGKGDKGGKADKQDTKGSRPPSQQFDITKPNWTLRIVVDATSAEDMEVKKDTERADEIRAMKKAWEDAEPGRAAKALQSRLKYLNTHMVKLQTDDEDAKEKAEGETSTDSSAEQTTEGSASYAAPPAPPPAAPHTPVSAPDPALVAAMDTGGEREVILTLEPPPPPTPREMLQPLDITPFIRKTGKQPRLLDEAETQGLLDERQQQIAEYKEFRQQLETWRAQDRAARNSTKIKQLEDAQKLQTQLDMLREEINVPREAFRQRYLEAERLRLEELAQQEAAMKAEQEAKSDKGRKSAKGKNSGKKKK